MSTLYQKLYAYLTGQVDDAITLLEDMIAEDAFDQTQTVRVKEKLENALLTAEERYLEAGEK